MENTQVFQFPIKGVSRAFSRTTQPEMTAYDMLNVVPFDRTGRLRGGKRWGSSKLWNSAIGGGAPIQLLDQTTIALDPNTIQADTQLLDETFTYANGALQTVATNAVWRTYNASGVSQLTALNVASNAIELNPSADATEKAIYQPSLVLGTAYLVKLQFTTPSSLTSHFTAGIMVRANKASPSTTGIYFNLKNNTDDGPTLELGTSLSGASLISTTLAAGYLQASTTYTMELRVNGDVFQIVIDDIVYGTATSTNESAQTGVGFFYSDEGTNNIPYTFDNFQVYTGENLASYRQTNIVAVSGGSVYMGDADTQAELVLSGSTTLHTTNIPQGAYSTGFYYFVDGFNIRKLNLTTMAMATYTATAGSSPTDCTLACMYRDRLVLAAPRGNPQNFFFSRVGTHTDWDYTQTDPGAAFQGNASVAGRIGEPIVAIFPFSDDMLAIGGDHNLWVIRGDLSDGGSIDLMSDAIGMLGARAFCKSPDGTIYMAATGGLYRWRKGADPEPLNVDGWPQYFQSINRGTHYVILAWDRDYKGCHIFVTPVNTGAATHLWYSEQTNGVYPIQYPNNHGPISALVYDGDAETDRVLMLGGRVGYVQKLAKSALSDDGTSIESYVIWTFPLGNGRNDGIITDVSLTYGEPASGFSATDWAVKCEIRGGRSAYDVVSGTHRKAMKDFGRMFGRVTEFRQPVRGAWGAIKLMDTSTDKHWSFETAVVTSELGGLTRR